MNRCEYRPKIGDVLHDHGRKLGGCINQIWNQVMNFETWSGYPVPATSHYCTVLLLSTSNYLLQVISHCGTDYLYLAVRTIYVSANSVH